MGPFLDFCMLGSYAWAPFPLVVFFSVDFSRRARAHRLASSFLLYRQSLILSLLSPSFLSPSSPLLARRCRRRFVRSGAYAPVYTAGPSGRACCKSALLYAWHGMHRSLVSVSCRVWFVV